MGGDKAAHIKYGEEINMEEIIKLLVLLAISVIANIAGGIYVNIGVNNYTWDWKKFVFGVIKAICVGVMFLVLAYVLEQIPSLAETLGVEPKAMLVSAIAIYVTKVVGHITSIFGFEKKERATEVEQTENEYMDM